jgi:hypothetical protein
VQSERLLGEVLSIRKEKEEEGGSMQREKEVLLGEVLPTPCTLYPEL